MRARSRARHRRNGIVQHRRVAGHVNMWRAAGPAITGQASMLFQSQGFILLFLPAAVAAYYCAAASVAARQRVLIAASLVFYGWWDVRFIPLLAGQIAATWALARLHEATGRNGFLVFGIILNLASLATFKYLDFLIGSAEAVAGVALPRAGLVLPIGISFFSFQLISYLVDRRRGDAPVYPLRPFALFVLLFPHLIAGPIVRHNELIPQFDADPRRDGLWGRICLGMVLFTLGLAKKVLLADRLADIADPLFAQAAGHPAVNGAVGPLSFGDAWSATLAFTLQLFCDFSAYTEMAIGIACLFGLLLPENFRRPYLATDLRAFWRCWHISLSTFIRDYLYIPLGGSRAGPARYVFATMGAMAVCGLWHGAGWTYVAWGLWHGAGLVVCRAWQSLKRPLPAVLGWALTMAFVMAGWVLFRAADFHTAASILYALGGGAGFTGSVKNAGLIAVAAVVAVTVPSAHEIANLRPMPWPAVAVGAALLAGVCVLEGGNGPMVSFIYFQF
jgi:D-alanyl-lipoteichoic acid acyltransferase DltB (MBOAT superfamily)